MFVPTSQIVATFITRDPATGAPVTPEPGLAVYLLISGDASSASVQILPIETGRYTASVLIPADALPGVVELIAKYTIGGVSVRDVFWRGVVADVAFHGEVELCVDDSVPVDRYSVQWFEQGVPIRDKARFANATLEARDVVSNAQAFSAIPQFQDDGVAFHDESVGLLSPGVSFAVTATVDIDGRPAVWRAVVSRDKAAP